MSNFAYCWDINGIETQFQVYFYYANIHAHCNMILIIFKQQFDYIANNYIEM